MPSDPVIHALAGGAAGCLAMSLTYPLVVISTRRAVAKRESISSSSSSSASASASASTSPQTHSSLSLSESIRSLPSSVLNDLKAAGVAISNVNVSPASIAALGGLYAGLGSSLIGIAVTNTVFYLFFEESKALLLRSKTARHPTPPVVLSTLESMLSSSIAGAATTILTNPIWVVQTYQATRMKKTAAVKGSEGEKAVEGAEGEKVEGDQSSAVTAPKPTTPTSSSSRLSMLGAANEIISNSGLPGLWKGLGPALILVINPVIQYTAFEQFAKLLATWRLRRKVGGGVGVKMTANTRLLTDFDMFWLGALSKLLATGVTYPYVLVKSRLQASTHVYANSFRAVFDIIKDEGVAGLYRGIGAKLLQSVLTAAFLFTAQRRVFELVKMLLQLQINRAAAGKA